MPPPPALSYSASAAAIVLLLSPCRRRPPLRSSPRDAAARPSSFPRAAADPFSSPLFFCLVRSHRPSQPRRHDTALQEEVAHRRLPERARPLSSCRSTGRFRINRSLLYHRDATPSIERGPNSPNKPALWTENWTSRFLTYGSDTQLRSPEDIACAVALFIARKKGSFVNYYMYHGGTNFGWFAFSYVTTSYYDGAPLDEYGLIWQPTWGHSENCMQQSNSYRDRCYWTVFQFFVGSRTRGTCV